MPQTVHGASTGRTSVAQLAATIAQLLAGAVRHHSLYPEDHGIARQHVDKIMQTFENVFAERKTLRLDVDTQRLLHDGKEIYMGRNEENDLAFLLARDGIEWIEFSRDLDRGEIQALLRVINANRRSDLENDGNIATALWEEDLPHIEHKTIDLMAMDLPVFDLGKFSVGPATGQPGEAPQPRAEDPESRTGSPEGPDSWQGDPVAQDLPPGLTLAAAGDALWNLSQEEENQLALMVRREEQGPDPADTVEILFLLLLMEKNPEEGREILNFIADRFLFCLQGYRFGLALKIVRTLKAVGKKKKQRKWLSAQIDSILDNAAQPESLKDLREFLTQDISQVNQHDLRSLWSLLGELPGPAIETLALLSQGIDLQTFGSHLSDLIRRFCVDAPSSVAAAAVDIHPRLCLDLIPFLPTIQTSHSIPILTGLALHKSARIRRQAFQLLDQWGAIDPVRLFTLIDDEETGIRTTLLQWIGRARDPKLESMLLEYLQRQDEEADPKRQEHVLACYQALGKTGSTRCLPFLQEQLRRTAGLGTLFSKAGKLRRQGVIRALRELHLPEARAILRREKDHG